MKRKLLLITFCLLVNITFAEAQNEILDKMFPNLVISRDHYEKFQEERAKKGSNPFKLIYNSYIDRGINSIVDNDGKTTPVVSLTNNPNNVDVGAEMDNIYRLCIAYLFTLEEKYLNKAVEFLVEWSKINVAVNRYNIHESKYTSAVEGYSIIRNVIDQDSRTTIDNWVRKRVTLFRTENDLRDNNWGTCLMQQIYTYGLVLNDQDCLNYFNTNYKTWVPRNLYPNGTGEDLLGRDAFAYHAYNIVFYAKICHAIALYEGYEKADAFYAQDVNWGASIKKSVDFWKPYILDPVKNPHLEFIETEWAPDKNRDDYNKPYSPAGTMYTIDEIYEMDQELLPAIEKYRGGNQFATWRLTLSTLRWYFEDNE